MERAIDIHAADIAVKTAILVFCPRDVSAGKGRVGRLQRIVYHCQQSIFHLDLVLRGGIAVVEVQRCTLGDRDDVAGGSGILDTVPLQAQVHRAADGQGRVTGHILGQVVVACGEGVVTAVPCGEVDALTGCARLVGVGRAKRTHKGVGVDSFTSILSCRPQRSKLLLAGDLCCAVRHDLRAGFVGRQIIAGGGGKTAPDIPAQHTEFTLIIATAVCAGDGTQTGAVLHSSISHTCNTAAVPGISTAGGNGAGESAVGNCSAIKAARYAAVGLIVDGSGLGIDTVVDETVGLKRYDSTAGICNDSSFHSQVFDGSVTT